METNIRPATALEAKALIPRARHLIESRPAPTVRYPKTLVDWPASPLHARLLIGGVQLLDSDDGYEDAAYVDAFLSENAPNGVGIWALGGEDNGVVIGHPPYDGIRNWIKSDLVLSPSIILSVDQDIVFMANEQLRYAVLGATEALLTNFDRCFGGKYAFFKKAKKHIHDMEIGFGQEDRDWALKHLLPWSFGADSTAEVII